MGQLDDSEVFETFAAKCGEVAFRKLWQVANATDTATAQQERLLQWFAEMAMGKPRTMDASPASASGGVGVVILPAVDIAEQ